MTQDSASSPSGRFLLYYDISGTHAVPVADFSGNGIPDYIDSAGVILDHVWDIEIDSMGFRPPIDPSGLPVAAYPVYFQDLQNEYGNTFSLSRVDDVEPIRYAAYTVLDNDYSESIYFVRGYEALKAVAAHEFHHAIQLAYGVWWDHGEPVDYFLMEMTSTWIEDVVFDNIDRYLQFLPALFSGFSNTSLLDTRGDLPYANGLFFHMLEEVFGRQIVPEIWERIPRMTGVLSLEEALREYGTTLQSQLHEYARWMMFTADRSPVSFPEGESYPVLRIPQRDQRTLDRMLDLRLDVQPLATRYLEIRTEDSGDVIARFQDNLGNLLVSYYLDGESAGSIRSNHDVGFFLDEPSILTALFTNASPDPVSVTFTLSKESISRREGVIAFPNPVRTDVDESVTFSSVPADGNILIYSSDFHLVKRLRGTGHPFRVVWDLTSERGETVSSGMYVYFIDNGEITQHGKIMIVR